MGGALSKGKRNLFEFVKLYLQYFSYDAHELNSTESTTDGSVGLIARYMEDGRRNEEREAGATMRPWA